jgi:hypothetical protein
LAWIALFFVFVGSSGAVPLSASLLYVVLIDFCYSC